MKEFIKIAIIQKITALLLVIIITMGTFFFIMVFLGIIIT